MATKTKRERFEKVAGSRVQMALDKLDNLSKCANKRNYEFNDKDINKMFRAIYDKIKIIRMRFNAEIENNGKEKKIFKF